MLKLNNITLILLSGIDYRTDRNINAIKYSTKDIEFGAVKYIQQGNIVDIDTWNHAVIYDLRKYLETDYCLLIHENGFVVHPESWKDEWLEYDYIGAPFPLPGRDIPDDGFSYRDDRGEMQRVGNSVSLRSKKLLDLIATRPWRSYYGNTHEDGFITCHNRSFLEENGCKIAPIEVAKYFSRELEVPENQDVDKPFCFHYNKFQTGRNLEYGKLFIK